MGIVINMYKKNFLQRYDKDEAIPYYAGTDFPGLCCEESSFRNTAGIDIRYFIYSYEGYDKDKLILFCPGMGPGHTAYLAEIETLCQAGLRVLTLDYSGCGASGGERMPSANAPTKDVMALLDLLKPKEEIILVGHSLGGYTALNVVNLSPDIHRAVILSGFLSISDEMIGYVKLRLLADVIRHYEKKLDPKYGALDNHQYLKKTKDHLLFIHSTDDPMVNYPYNAGWVKTVDNPNVRLITVEGKKHNPQYTREALEAMNTWIGEYNRQVQSKQLDTLEAKKHYFEDKPIGKMTAQDPEIYREILGFIGGCKG